MTSIRHIRTTDRNVKDHRFRSHALYANSMRSVKTFCSAEPTCDDVSRKDARHFIKHERIKPEWAANLCPGCRHKLAAKPARA